MRISELEDLEEQFTNSGGTSEKLPKVLSSNCSTTGVRSISGNSVFNMASLSQHDDILISF